MPNIFFRRFLLSAISLCALPVLALADSVYVSDTLRFGSIDLTTGAYHQIGPDLPDASQGLGYAPNGSLLTIGFSGNVNSINPSTGAMTPVGPSGLSDCSTPASPCTSNSINVLASFNGQTYVTDFLNRLYSVNTATGAATLIGTTGMPAIPFIPLSENPDGTVNIYDEAFFGANGKLYATFDAGHVDFSTGTLTPVIGGELYQIDPATARATAIGPTVFGIGGAVDVNGTTYAFLDATHELATFDLLTGRTTVIGQFDEAAGIVSAAVATPEPATTASAGLGLAVLIACIWIRLRNHSSTQQ
jgi:hypothetical protein